MPRVTVLAALALAALSAVPAEAQTVIRENGRAIMVLNVRPRSYLDAGNVVPVGSQNFVMTGWGQTASHLNLPPYIGLRERYGAGVLPDPVTGLPFVGARPFGPPAY